MGEDTSGQSTTALTFSSLLGASAHGLSYRPSSAQPVRRTWIIHAPGQRAGRRRGSHLYGETHAAFERRAVQTEASAAVTVLDWIAIGCMLSVAVAVILVRLADAERRMSERLSLTGLQIRTIERDLSRLVDALHKESSDT